MSCRKNPQIFQCQCRINRDFRCAFLEISLLCKRPKSKLICCQKSDPLVAVCAIFLSKCAFLEAISFFARSVSIIYANFSAFPSFAHQHVESSELPQIHKCRCRNQQLLSDMEHCLCLPEIESPDYCARAKINKIT